MFGRECASSIGEYYVRAHFEMFELRDAPDIQFSTVRAIVNKKLNAVLIEPWLRGGMRRHILSRKLLLISYLAECDADHPEYLNFRGRNFLTMINFMLTGVRALLGLAYGWSVKSWYGLV